MLMKRNISDLLDSYPVEGLDLGITTPYSSSRIKELTMNKVSMNKPRKHVRPLRFLAVAAIISTYCFCVGSWSCTRCGSAASEFLC